VKICRALSWRYGVYLLDQHAKRASHILLVSAQVCIRNIRWKALLWRYGALLRRFVGRICRNTHRPVGAASRILLVLARVCVRNMRYKAFLRRYRTLVQRDVRVCAKIHD